MKATKHDFPIFVLTAAEKFQQYAGQSFIGKSIVKAVTGSNSDCYEQLQWRSRGISQVLKSTVIAEGDPNAAKLPRFWSKAFVMSTPADEIEDVLSDTQQPYHEAVGYVTKNVLHVGVRRETSLLHGNTPENNRIIAMRLGKAPVEATMGIWLPNESTFISTENIRVADASISIADLPQKYPNVTLV